MQKADIAKAFDLKSNNSRLLKGVFVTTFFIIYKQYL